MNRLTITSKPPKALEHALFDMDISLGANFTKPPTYYLESETLSAAQMTAALRELSGSSKGLASKSLKSGSEQLSDAEIKLWLNEFERQLIPAKDWKQRAGESDLSFAKRKGNF